MCDMSCDLEVCVPFETMLPETTTSIFISSEVKSFFPALSCNLLWSCSVSHFPRSGRRRYDWSLEDYF